MGQTELVLFNPIKAELSIKLGELRAITKVTDEPGAMVAQFGLKSLTTMIGSAEGLRKTLKQPHIDAGKAIDDYCKEMMEEPAKIQAQLKRVLLDWNNELAKKKEQERKAAEEAKRLEDEKRALEAARDVSPADDFDMLLKPEAQVQRESIIKTENAKVEQFVADKKHSSHLKAIDKQKVKGMRKVWRFEVTDEAQVPRDLLMVNEFAIRERMKAAQIVEGEIEKLSVPGVRFYTEEIIAAR